MPLLRCGLNVGVLVAVIASVASWLAGYPVEVALLRGLLAFPLIAFAAFFAELVVSTAPPAPARDTAKPDKSSAEHRPAGTAPAFVDRDAAADRRAA